MLCDFGLTIAADEAQTGLTTSLSFKGSVQYFSHELVMSEEPRRTPSSDMWSWGCLPVEVRLKLHLHFSSDILPVDYEGDYALLGVAAGVSAFLRLCTRHPTCIRRPFEAAC